MSRGRAVGLFVSALLLTWLMPWGRLPAEPDLVLIVAVLVAAARPPLDGVLFAATAGLMQDALSLEVFGTRTAALALVALIAGRMARDLSVESLQARIILLSVAVGIAGALGWLVVRVAAEAPSAAPGALVAVVTTVLLGAVLWSVVSAARPQRPVW